MPPLARLSDLPVGSTLAVTMEDGTRICLVNDGGEISAISDLCTHQGYSMASGNVLGEGRIECAWHGTVYDCRTGAVERGPATEPIAVYEVTVENGEIYVGERAR
ncbi:MAG TPA: Rieske 2Fe-2S domain-containing protein [Gemmatimonadaceae bacterium]|nr:Rieske 2Fe-2S domain-containing protein [Gemmatimonadaceae bacterium]